MWSKCYNIIGNVIEFSLYNAFNNKLSFKRNVKRKSSLKPRKEPDSEPILLRMTPDSGIWMAAGR